MCQIWKSCLTYFCPVFGLLLEWIWMCCLKFKQNVCRCVSVCPHSLSAGLCAYQYLLCLLCVCVCFVSPGTVISQVSTGKSSWPTCVTASRKPRAKKKVQFILCCSPNESSETNELEHLVLWEVFVCCDYWYEQHAPVFKTLRRKVRLCCLCWSGAASWRLQAGFRLKSWAGPFAACTLEVKVPAGHTLTHIN